MGLSSLPAPSEGFLCIILVNTALTISIFKGIVQSVLHLFGVRPSTSSSSSSDSTENYSEAQDYTVGPIHSYIDEFRNRTPTIRFDTVHSCKKPEHDCSICWTQFKPASEINHLSCGHFFHKGCLEKWLEYWNVTCPLCRTPLMAEEDAFCFW